MEGEPPPFLTREGGTTYRKVENFSILLFVEAYHNIQQEPGPFFKNPLSQSCFKKFLGPKPFIKIH